MYFFAHLLAGILLGVLLAYLLRDSRLIPACALGSILPDLIDKPVGLLLFPEIFGTGRIFGHALLVVGLVLFIGILVYTRYPRTGILLLALVAGIFTHQVLDAMWLQPANWYWPTLGSFTREVPAGLLRRLSHEGSQKPDRKACGDCHPGVFYRCFSSPLPRLLLVRFN